MLSPKRESQLSRDKLLDYYRSVCDGFERERQELQQKLDAVAGVDNQRHQLRFQLQQTVEQVADLQRALSDAHIQLFEEKERVVRLQAENFDLNSAYLTIHRLQYLFLTPQPNILSASSESTTLSL